MTGIAEELRRRSSKEYVKDRAREVVVKSGTKVKDRIVGSPMAWTIFGGLAGAGLGSLSARWYLGRQDRERYEIETGPDIEVESPGEAQAKVDELKDKTVDLKETAKEKIADAKDTVVGKVQQYKDQVPDLQARGKSALQRGIDEAPWSILFGALAAGAAISFLIPVTDPERRVFKQYKGKAVEKLQGIKEQAAQKLEELAQKADDRISHLAEQDVRPNTRGSTLPH